MPTTISADTANAFVTFIKLIFYVYFSKRKRLTQSTEVIGVQSKIDRRTIQLLKLRKTVASTYTWLSDYKFTIQWVTLSFAETKV